MRGFSFAASAIGTARMRAATRVATKAVPAIAAEHTARLALSIPTFTRPNSLGLRSGWSAHDLRRAQRPEILGDVSECASHRPQVRPVHLVDRVLLVVQVDRSADQADHR